MKSSDRLAALISLLVTVAVPAPSGAQTTIDFEDLACTGAVSQPFASYTFQGFTLTTSVPGQTVFGVPCSGHPAYPGEVIVLANYIFAVTMTLARVDGGAFSLQSIDLAPFQGQFPITFVGVRANLAQVSQTFLLSGGPPPPPPPGPPPVLQRYAFDPGFADLVSVRWDQDYQNRRDAAFFDDIVVATVPEPSALILLATGLAGIALIPRRKAA